MMLYATTIFLLTTLAITIISTFPIEIKDIQYLFPPQNTFADVAGGYHTQIDRQLGDSQEEKAEKACIPKQNADQNAEDTETPTEKLTNDGFTDNSPINGTIVDDPMEVKIYKPECDD